MSYAGYLIAYQHLTGHPRGTMFMNMCPWYIVSVLIHLNALYNIELCTGLWHKRHSNSS